MALFNKVDLKKVADSKTRSLMKSAGRVLLDEASSFSEYRTYDIFLSHSSLDADIILALKTELNNLGLSIYVDWIEDPQLDRNHVTKTTARMLQQRMKNCKCLLYAISESAVTSKWMPWELGYFDGLKSRVALIPVLDNPNFNNSYRGQEYLSLYPYITKDFPRDGNSQILWVFTDSGSYSTFASWIN